MAMRKRKLKHNLIRFGVAWLLRVTNRTPRVLFYHVKYFESENR